MDFFDEPLDRRQTNSYKWSVGTDELPMWVADMDFQTAPEIIEAVSTRMQQGAFGYNTIPAAFNQAVVAWWQRRHQFSTQADWILFCTGVVPAISSIVRKLSRVGDNIVVLSPVYNIFYHSIVNNHRKVCSSELIYAKGRYMIDFADLEERLSNENTSLLIFCNPHNPIGKIWSKDVLERVGQLCLKHAVIIISDEIHCDLTFPGKSYIPFASLSKEIGENVITCVSPSKAFNIAGLQTSALIIQNEKLRKLVERGINTDEIAEPNTFAIQAAIAAFTKGEGWLSSLTNYLYENRLFLEEFFHDRIPSIQVVKSEGTYLAWLDCSQLTDNGEELCLFVRKKTGLVLSSGGMFGSNSRSFVRLNYGTTRERLKDGLTRLEAGVNLYQSRQQQDIQQR